MMDYAPIFIFPYGTFLRTSFEVKSSKILGKLLLGRGRREGGGVFKFNVLGFCYFTSVCSVDGSMERFGLVFF